MALAASALKKPRNTCSPSVKSGPLTKLEERGEKAALRTRRRADDGDDGRHAKPHHAGRQKLEYGPRARPAARPARPRFPVQTERRKSARRAGYSAAKVARGHFRTWMLLASTRLPARGADAGDECRLLDAKTQSKRRARPGKRQGVAGPWLASADRLGMRAKADRRRSERCRPMVASRHANAARPPIAIAICAIHTCAADGHSIISW